jgi:hypothetical protein
MAATTKKVTKSSKAAAKTSARRKGKVTAKKAVATRTRVVDEKRDAKIVSALKKGVTTSQFRDELGVYTSGSMLSNLKPVAKRHNFKIKQEGTKGKYVYKFIGGGK